MRLLLVEDDIPLGHGIRAGLTLENHSVDWVTDGQAAGRLVQREHFDVIVLDLGLPCRDGLEILSDMRARGDDTPVLVLTARDSVSDRINGLDAGSDDYMTKPFDLGELLARLRALGRRNTRFPPTLLRNANITVDLAAHTVEHNGRLVHTSPLEFSILRLLLENAGRVLPRSMLEQALYGLNIEIESNTIEVYIHFLRRKLGGDIIRTVRGIGYIIDRCE